MNKNRKEETNYQSPEIFQLEFVSEGYLAASTDKYSNWNDGTIENRFNDLGNF